MTTLSREETEALIAEVLEIYPEKAKKDRAKHLTVNDQSVEQSKKCITSNRKSVPGVMTQRGCAYADVCALLLYLAGDESSYVTGQALNVDGGQTMH